MVARPDAAAARSAFEEALALPDSLNPDRGHAIFFLVTGVHNGIEGSLGKNSAGVERPNTNPCP